MKVTMKRYEKLAGDHAKKFAKAWDYYTIATGAYLEAYRQAREDIFNELNNQDNPKQTIHDQYAASKILEIGNEEVEIEYLDGEHQLSAATFKKWKEENNG